MLTNKFYCIFTILITSILIVGCSSDTKSKNDTSDLSVADTSQHNVDSTAVVYPVLPNEFKSSEEALHYIQNSKDWDKYRDGIIPRMIEENLAYADKLLHNEYSRFIVVDKDKMKVQLYDKFGRKEFEYGMACARNYGTKHEKGDSRTPEGFFSVEGVYNSTDWLFTDDNGVTSPVKGQFGPRFIRLKIPNTSQIGIHGTRAPWSIGSRASHGCIRVTNDHIMHLIEYVEVGMPVIVNPGTKDIKVNLEEGYNVPYITTDNKPIKMPKIEKYKEPKNDTIESDTIVSDSISTDVNVDATITERKDTISSTPIMTKTETNDTIQ